MAARVSGPSVFLDDDLELRALRLLASDATSLDDLSALREALAKSEAARATKRVGESASSSPTRSDVVRAAARRRASREYS